MTLRYRTEGFVFKKDDRLESDRVFSVFTKDFGRIEVFGKAIRKINSKLRSGIEIFSLSEIEFVQGRNKKTLTDTALIGKFKNIEQDPEKFEVAYKILNVLDDFIKGEEKDEEILDFIKDIFVKLDLQETNNKFLYYYFFWNFMLLLGYGPELSKCAACAKELNPQNLYFSNKEGGIVCAACLNKSQPSKKVNAGAIKVLRLILKKDFDVLSRLKIDLTSKKILKEISDNYCLYLLSNHFFVNN